ncbi:MAG TPA: UDP-N-acetylglucosamine 1-carboxyvinyltransferase [Clostridiaceae bacterium]
MEKIIIKGGRVLKGEVEISAAKNSVLPIIVASILTEGRCIIHDVPVLEDVCVICQVLKDSGAKIIYEENNTINIDNTNLKNIKPEDSLVQKMRASFLITGPMLARFGGFKISLPGGCNIGARPIDLHLKGFTALGAQVSFGHGYVEAKAIKLIGNKIYLDFPSVGATENIMMAATLAEGDTIIENAAIEPEIEDLSIFLCKMGGKIEGAGTDTIKITGVKELKGTNHTPIKDRIEAGTFMVAAAITNSMIKIKGANESHLKPVIAKLTEMGVRMEILKDGILVDGRAGLRPTDIKTLPYPGFPTDMQSQMMSLLSVVKGTSIISETIFENRFMHVSELKRMGANIKIDGRTAIIEGKERLSGSEVKATDLRAGAGLILAALSAEGTTSINDIYHVDRGYVDIEKKLQGLDADIIRVNY